MVPLFTLFCTIAACLQYSEQSTLDDACPLNVPQDEYRQVYSNLCLYFFVYRRSEYRPALLECQKYGGTLALVTSGGLQDFIATQTALTYKQTNARLWIGLNDLDGDGVFTWTDGSALNYSNWAVGEGMGKHPGELCAVLDIGQHGRWYDYSCSNQEFSNYEQPYVCQFSSRLDDHVDVTGEIMVATVTSLTHPCAAFTCDLDCGTDGYKKNALDGCSICECNV